MEDLSIEQKSEISLYRTFSKVFQPADRKVMPGNSCLVPRIELRKTKHLGEDLRSAGCSDDSQNSSHGGFLSCIPCLSF